VEIDLEIFGPYLIVMGCVWNLFNEDDRSRIQPRAVSFLAGMC
jgi:hypothetical protein